MRLIVTELAGTGTGDADDRTGADAAGVPPRAGDAAWEPWQRLVRAHVEAVWRCALAAGLDASDAATVCELAWLRLAQHWSPRDGRTETQIRAGLLASVRREATGLLRTRHRPRPAGTGPWAGCG